MMLSAVIVCHKFSPLTRTGEHSDLKERTPLIQELRKQETKASVGRRRRTPDSEQMQHKRRPNSWLTSSQKSSPTLRLQLSFWGLSLHLCLCSSGAYRGRLVTTREKITDFLHQRGFFVVFAIIFILTGRQNSRVFVSTIQAAATFPPGCAPSSTWSASRRGELHASGVKLGS
jgi:hypothetical protein